LTACDAAVRFLGKTSAQVAHTHRHARTYVPYVPREVIDAITRFHDRFGTWPTKWEYNEWGRLERQAARHTGAPDPRIPSMGQVAKAYGTYDRAVQLANDASAPPLLPRSVGGPRPPRTT
jgi:YD repeat-containing protein